jgi:hypothetical protein
VLVLHHTPIQQDDNCGLRNNNNLSENQMVFVDSYSNNNNNLSETKWSSSTPYNNNNINAKVDQELPQLIIENKPPRLVPITFLSSSISFLFLWFVEFVAYVIVVFGCGQ